MNPNLNPRQFGEYVNQRGPADLRTYAAMTQATGGYANAESMITGRMPDTKHTYMDGRMARNNSMLLGMTHVN